MKMEVSAPGFGSYSVRNLRRFSKACFDGESWWYWPNPQDTCMIENEPQSSMIYLRYQARVAKVQ
jgi:hypothetical protein